MADAFRGLTLKLGADARPVNSAINSIMYSAGQAQKQMTRLSKALKFDPTDVRAMAARLDLAGDKALLSARQTQVLRTALKQAAAESKKLFAGSSYDGKKIQDMANNTREVYSETQRLLSEYNHLDAELQTIYDAMKRTMVASKEWKDVTSFGQASKVVNALKRNLESTGAKADFARKHLEDLLRVATANPKKSGIDLSKTFGLGGSALDPSKMVAAWYRIRKAQKAASGDLDAMHAVEGYRAMASSLAAARAEMRQGAAEAARLKTELYALGSSSKLANAASDAMRLDNALEQAMSTADEMKNAVKMLPASMDAARVKAKAVADAEDVLKQKIAAVKAKIDTIQNTKGFDKVAASTKNAYVEVEKAEGKYAKLKYKLDGATTAAEHLQQELKEGLRVDSGKSAADLEKIKSKLEKVEAAAASLRAEMAGVEGEMKTANLSKALVEAQGEVTKLEGMAAKLNFEKTIWSKLGGTGQAFRQFGYGMYASITPAIMMTGRYAINAAEQIDSSYRNMRKTVNGTEEQFEHLKDAAVEFSRSHVTSADQILEIEAIGGQLGISANDLEAFATTVSNLDIATNMDTEDIALSLAKLSNIMHFGQDQYDSFADSLVRLGNNEPALESDIMKISTRFAGMAANVGMGTADMLAFATAATATGQKAEAAGGSMQRTIGRIEKAVAGGGDTLEGFAKVSGMSASEFSASWEDVEHHGPAKTLQAFVEGLHNVKANGGSVTKTLAELGITGVRDTQLLEGLSNTTDVLSESLEMANDAWDGMSTTMKDGTIELAGDAAREAQRKSEGFSGELQMMKNNAAALAIEAGEGAAPWVKMLGSYFKDLAGQVRAMTPEMKSGIVGIAGITAAAGPAAVALGTVISSIGNIHEVVKGGQGKLRQWSTDLITVKDGAKEASRSAKGLSKFLSFASSGGGFLALTAAAGVIKLIVDHFAELNRRAELFASSGSKISHMFDNLRFGEVNLDTNAIMIKYDDIKRAAEEAAQANIDMADKMSSSLRDVSNKSATLDDLVSKITGLKSAGKLSASQVDTLRGAIKQLNDMTGASFTVTDHGTIKDQKGKVKDLTKALKELSQQQKISWQMDAMGEGYKSAQQTASEAYNKLMQGEKTLQKMIDGRNEKQRQATENLGNGELYKALEEEITQADKDIENYRNEVTNLKNEWKNADDAAKILAGDMNAMSVAAENINSVEGVFTQFDQASLALQQNGLNLEMLSNSVKGLGYDYDALKNLATEDVQAIEEQWTGSIPQLNTLLGEHGVKISDAANSTAQLASNMGLGAQGFSDLYNACNGSVNDMRMVLDDLSNYQFETLSFDVSDDGTIQANIGYLDELGHYQIGTLSYRVSDNGTLQVVSSEVDALKGKVSEPVEGSVKISTEDATKKTADVKTGLDEVDKKNPKPKINAVDNASDKIKTVNGYINALPLSRTVNLYENTYKTTIYRTQGKPGQATGGINMAPLYRMPAFAAGGAINGIVRRAMVTSQGIIGEAGDEAVLNMGRSAAVVPLSNRRYVRPFAKAVASEMGGSVQPVQSTVMNVYLDGKFVAGGVNESTTLGELASGLRRKARA